MKISSDCQVGVAGSQQDPKKSHECCETRPLFARVFLVCWSFSSLLSRAKSLPIHTP